MPRGQQAVYQREISHPTFLTVPPTAVGNLADDLADFALSLGQQVGEEERIALGALSPVQADGRWAGLSAAIVAGRRNIKSWALEIRALYDLYVVKVDRVVWTAHLFTTSQENFLHVQGLVRSYDWLDRRTKRISTENGSEGLILHNGSRLDFVARQAGRSGRGGDIDTLILDEWLYGTPAMSGAMIPAMGVVPNPHVLYASSPGLMTSASLRDVRNRGRSGGDPSLSYCEWTSPWRMCATESCTHLPGSTGCVLDDEALWFLANPALGRRMSLEFVRNERAELPPIEFMRERLGWWEDPPAEGIGTAYPVDLWDELSDEASHIPDGGYLVFAVDVSWDRSVAHVSVAGVREDGLRHVQVIASMEPSAVVKWLVDRLRRFAPLAVAVQGAGAPASSLVEELDNVGVPIHRLGGGDLAKAHGLMFDAIKAGRLRHLGEPGLRQQVATAITRPLADGNALDRKKSPIDISGLVAITEALWVLDELVGSADYDVASSVA